MEHHLLKDGTVACPDGAELTRKGPRQNHQGLEIRISNGTESLFRGNEGGEQGDPLISALPPKDRKDAPVVSLKSARDDAGRGSVRCLPAMI